MPMLYVIAGLGAAFGLLNLITLAALWSKLMATQADLDTALATLSTTVAANTTATNAAVAKIGAGGTPPDLQPAVDAVNTANSTIAANNDTLIAASA